MDTIIKIFLENPIAQIIWIIAFIVNFIAYSSSKDKLVKIIWGIALLIRAIHYGLLWLYTGWIIAIIWFFRNIYSIKFLWNKKIMYIFWILYIIGSILTYKSLFSIYSIVAALIYLYALFNLKWLELRYAMIIWNIFWWLYAWYWQSIWLFISEIVFTIGTISSIIKIRRNNNRFLYKFLNWIYIKNFIKKIKTFRNKKKKFFV